MAEKHLNTIEVAHILDLCPDDVGVLARKKILRGRKKGRQWRFTKRDVMYFAKKMKGE